MRPADRSCIAIKASIERYEFDYGMCHMNIPRIWALDGIRFSGGFSSPFEESLAANLALMCMLGVVCRECDLGVIPACRARKQQSQEAMNGIIRACLEVHELLDALQLDDLLVDHVEIHDDVALVDEGPGLLLPA